ncbi:MAG: hypothetical protein K2K32_03955 [Muribaculaceae bacterium]|nr:hypothetical protein [Muribaculaceae bacterium]
MKTRHIFLMLASVFMMLGTYSCSDNVDSDLIPTLGERTLTVDGHETAFTMNLNAGPSTTEIKVESNTLWKVEVVCEGGWCSVDKVSGRGNESFSMSLRDNMISKRTCSVTVYMVDAQGEKLEGVPGSSLTITVTQDVSDVRLTPSSVAPFKPQGNERQLFEVIANVAWTLDVSYEGDNASEFVVITPESGDINAVGDGSFQGEDTATFYISVADNRTATDRKAYLNLRSATGNYTVEISQIKSEYSFDVSPAENQVVAAEGGKISFGILSIVGWDVRTAADWITFNPASSSEGSENRVTTEATVLPNTSGRERSAEIRFVPRNESYSELSLTITQRGYDITFAISSADASAIAMESGESLSFDLDSRFNWTLETPSWVSADAQSGNASTAPREIKLTVQANTTNNNRTGYVTVYPQNTTFAGGVTLDPSVMGVEPLRFSVTQFGGREPAVSVPWLLDDYTQTSAIIEFNYYSPFANVVEAALQWRRVGETNWNTVQSTVSDPTEGTVTVELNSLEPATRYEARGYVKDANGTVKYGSVSYPFNTAGQYPGSSDNPTPSK